MSQLKGKQPSTITILAQVRKDNPFMGGYIYDANGNFVRVGPKDIGLDYNPAKKVCHNAVSNRTTIE